MPFLKVMTFNLRYDNPADGENRWDLRKEAVAKVIQDYNPVVFGTQEGWEDQIKTLAKLIPSYRFYLFAPEWNRKRMFPCVWVDKKIDVLQYNTFWLSPTPNVPFSRAWGSAYPRAATYVMAKIEKTPFFFVCTHLDNISAKARLNQAVVLYKEIKRLNQDRHPVILVGDFNTSPESDVYAFLTGKKEVDGLKGSFVDVWRALGHPEESTFHVFTGQGVRGRIDWILVSPEVKIKKVFLIKDKPGGRYPSDHFPVIASLEIRKVRQCSRNFLF
jgi:endonuclease/exonuclease/phosphatase family metal-dependent hydrolase